jgi:hypothetical protein
MNPTWLDYLQAGGLVVGLVLVLIGLHWQRSANFIAAWQILVSQLQEDKLRGGRYLLRQLQLTKAPKDPASWTAPPDWVGSSSDVIPFAKAAYDSFDLAGIMVLHSKIPGLTSVFVAEYADSIISCWEQGEFFLKQRAMELQPAGQPSSRSYVRGELYQSFSVLYVMAKHRHDEVRPTTYPFYSLRDRWALHRCSRDWEASARAERDRLVAEALSQPNPALHPAARPQP